MKIITLHQPYASLIALGLKRYETRSWATNYRGKLAIHAAKQPLLNASGNVVNPDYATAWVNALMLASEAGMLNDQSHLSFGNQLPLGAIVAVVDLIDCMEMQFNSTEPYEKGICINYQTQLEKTVGDWRVGRWAWKLDNIMALPEPIPYKGAQGLRFLEDDAIALIDAQMGVAA